MPAAKLSIYNNALGHLGERKLASLTENREPRRVLDDFYDNVLRYCLEQGQWTVSAGRQVEIAASGSVTPSFGFSNAFAKPSDWVRTIRISDSETFDPPLLRFSEQRGFWYSDASTLYVEYVSNSATLGGLDLSRWSEAYENYVTLRLARLACPRIANDSTRRQELLKEERKALAEARNLETSGKPPLMQMGGSWVRSRGGNSNTSRWDGTMQ